MVREKSVQELDTFADILARAFDSPDKLPSATAELILQAKLPEADIQRVRELLNLKRDGALTGEQEALLQDYLHVDSVLTLLKSKARHALGRVAA